MPKFLQLCRTFGSERYALLTAKNFFESPNFHNFRPFLTRSFTVLEVYRL